jgi:hypothetical protein
MAYDPKLHERLNRQVELEEKMKGRERKADTPEITNNLPDELAPSIAASPRSYIEIPDTNTVIAIAETHKGKNMFDTLEALVSENLEMPSIRNFMKHWMNVKGAAQGKTRLLYADGTPVGDDVSQDLWAYMSSGHRGGCWTWLNALFKNDETNKKWYIETELKVKTNTKGERYLEGQREESKHSGGKNCYVSLIFNEQGLPIVESSINVYRAGQNIYFVHPQADCVAGFYACSDGAVLGCGRGPSFAYPSLGVFASGRKNFLGGNK